LNAEWEKIGKCATKIIKVKKHDEELFLKDLKLQHCC